VGGKILKYLVKFINVNLCSCLYFIFNAFHTTVLDKLAYLTVKHNKC